MIETLDVHVTNINGKIQEFSFIFFRTALAEAELEYDPGFVSKAVYVKFPVAVDTLEACFTLNGEDFLKMQWRSKTDKSLTGVGTYEQFWDTCTCIMKHKHLYIIYLHRCR